MQGRDGAGKESAKVRQSPRSSLSERELQAANKHMRGADLLETAGPPPALQRPIWQQRSEHIQGTAHHPQAGTCC